MPRIFNLQEALAELKSDNLMTREKAFQHIRPHVAENAKFLYEEITKTENSTYRGYLFMLLYEARTIETQQLMENTLINQPELVEHVEQINKYKLNIPRPKAKSFREIVTNSDYIPLKRRILLFRTPNFDFLIHWSILLWIPLIYWNWKFTLILIISLSIHEIFHLIADQFLNQETGESSLTLYFLGLKFYSFSPENNRFTKDTINKLKFCLLSIAGPFANSLLLVTSYFLSQAIHDQYLLLNYAVITNYILLLFTFFPLVFTDGGNIIYCIGSLAIKNKSRLIHTCLVLGLLSSFGCILCMFPEFEIYSLSRTFNALSSFPIQYNIFFSFTFWNEKSKSQTELSIEIKDYIQEEKEIINSLDPVF